MSVQEREAFDVSEREGPWRAERRESVRRRRIGRLQRRWWGRRIITLFICWHLLAVLMWLMPSSALVDFFTSNSGIVRPYMTFTGFMQNWQMFSPTPDSLDVYREARVTYADGSMRSWMLPRMVDMGYVGRYQRERWRKMTEVVTHHDYPMVSESLARYEARLHDPSPHNPPRIVQLVKHARGIPPPGFPIPRYATETLYTKVITPEDLR